MIKIALVVGARPNFMKAIPIWNSLKQKIPKEQLYFITRRVGCGSSSFRLFVLQ